MVIFSYCFYLCFSYGYWLYRRCFGCYVYDDLRCIAN